MGTVENMKRASVPKKGKKEKRKSWSANSQVLFVYVKRLTEDEESQKKKKKKRQKKLDKVTTKQHNSESKASLFSQDCPFKIIYCVIFNKTNKKQKRQNVCLLPFMLLFFDTNHLNLNKYYVV